MSSSMIRNQMKCAQKYLCGIIGKNEKDLLLKCAPPSQFVTGEESLTNV